METIGIVLFMLGAVVLSGIIVRVVAWIAGRRSVEGYDVVIEGTTPGDDAEAARAKVAPWEQAGATWWIESDWESPWESVRRRIEAGPPR